MLFCYRGVVILFYFSSLYQSLSPVGCDNVDKSSGYHSQPVPIINKSSDAMVNVQVPSFEEEYNLRKIN